MLARRTIPSSPAVKCYPTAYAGRAIGLDTTLRCSRNSSYSRAARGLYSRRSSDRQIWPIGAPQSTLSSGLLDRGVRIPQRSHEPFQPLRSSWFAIVFKGGESVALFRRGVRSRIVPETTVSSKMIIGLRGLITIEL